MTLRPSVRLLAAALTGALLLLGTFFGGVAAAHSGATGSSPEDGAKVDRSPGVVSVTFNENLRSEFAYLTVVGPDGRLYQQGEPTVEGSKVSVPVNGLGPAGTYEINFRVTSADGHPVTGQRRFELTVAGDGQPGELAEPDAAFADDSSTPVWAVVLIGVALVLAVTGAVVAVIRRRGA
ncbi:MAG: copper resistance protein CopC [Gordonia sp. (in: high G+C Gram-positive bacteria)]|uniref:copper resistance CopC family protein n=1 Tax=Gordonia sp. (in: high G+C Gram-positive bacteria) TaxID=84139 RepID=UPI0039E57E37